MLIISDNIKYNLELKDLSNILFAGANNVYLKIDEIARAKKDEELIKSLIQKIKSKKILKNNSQNLSENNLNDDNIENKSKVKSKYESYEDTNNSCSDKKYLNQEDVDKKDSNVCNLNYYDSKNIKENNILIKSELDTNNFENTKSQINSQELTTNITNSDNFIEFYKNHHPKLSNNNKIVNELIEKLDKNDIHKLLDEIENYVINNHDEIIYINKIDNYIKISLSKDNKTIYEDYKIIDYKEKSIYKKLLYQTLMNNYPHITGKWGTLTGIRPVKIVHDLHDEGKNKVEIEKILKEKYMVSDEKISLLFEIADIQQQIKQILADDISIYISIPFCPSRCNYCSFFSIDVASGKKYIKDYLKNLDIEIEKTLKLPYFKDKNITCIYVGGGTPSSLDEEELKIFFKIINNHFDCKVLFI